ncbi:ABC transporter substrate-binding protein [Bifidobacterium saguinibicoloris]|uniref:ABC transporter substrate-binding protein n=1 Tax=Bifidobacterium saguinibicoloris TaxID=2834433 RepID=UPI001C57E074|nr:ABC transporter substrate-binding protein [Bifidobacterium saguinibicoloris]MBW3080939.1 ABC transporter substrate-binding protein [Bifidobacterium saguinibicoloris]
MNRSHAHIGRAAAVCASLAAILLASACGQAAGGNAQSADAGTPVKGGTLRIAQPTDTVGCIDPFQTGITTTRTLQRNIVESLLDQDPKTGEIKPWLAKDYTASADGKTYTLHLKSGITFSDGEKFDADAVVKNFEDHLDPSHPVSTGNQSLTGLESVTKTDVSTVEFHLSAPNSSFLQTLTTTNLGIVSPKYLADVPFQQRCAAGKVVGTGPFTLEKFDTRTKTVLVRRDGYNSPSPFSTLKGDAYLDKIEVSYVPEKSVQIGSLNGGQIDVIWPSNEDSFDENDSAQIKQAGNSIQSRSVPGTSSILYPNVRYDGPLSDPKVLQAFSLGIDRKTYAETVLRSGYPVVQGIIDKTTPGFQANADAVKYDAKKAATLLDQAGWKKGDDGYRHKDGKKLTVHYITTKSSTGDVLLQDQLKKVGIDYQIDVLTQSEVASRTASGDYDLAKVTFTRADPAAMAVVDNLPSQWAPDAKNNKTDAQAKELKALFDKAVATSSESEKTTSYQEIQKYIEDNRLVIPIYERTQDAAVAAKVHGLRFTADSFGDFSGVWLG